MLEARVVTITAMEGSTVWISDGPAAKTGMTGFRQLAGGRVAGAKTKFLGRRAEVLLKTDADVMPNVSQTSARTREALLSAPVPAHHFLPLR